VLLAELRLDKNRVTEEKACDGEVEQPVKNVSRHLKRVYVYIHKIVKTLL